MVDYYCWIKKVISEFSKIARLLASALLTVNALSIIILLRPAKHNTIFEVAATLTMESAIALLYKYPYVTVAAVVFIMAMTLEKFPLLWSPGVTNAWEVFFFFLINFLVIVYTLLNLSISLKLGKYWCLSQERLIIMVRSQLIYQRMLGFFFLFFFFSFNFYIRSLFYINFSF